MKIFKTGRILIFTIFIFNSLYNDIDDKVITIGTTINMTGATSEYCNNLKEGLDLGVAHINKLGGINNKTLKLIAYDDKFNPETSLNNAKKLLKKDNVSIIIGSTSYNFLTEEKKLLYLFPDCPPIGSRNKNMVILFPQATQEMQVLLNHLVNKLNKKSIAILYHPDDDFCKEAYDYAVDFFKNKTDLSFKGFSILTNNMNNLKDIAQEIDKLNPDCLILDSYDGQAKELIKFLSSYFLVKTALACLSSLYSTSIQLFFKEKGLQLISTSYLPIYNKDNLDIIKIFNEESKSDKKYANTISPIGFLDILLFVDIYKKIEGEVNNDNIKDKIMQQIIRLQNYNFKGITLNYNPKTKYLCNNLWLNYENKSELIKLENLK